MKKNIAIKPETWQRLVLLKLNTGAKSMDVLIDELLDSYDKKRGEKR